MKEDRWLVAQLGARRHYAIPRMLHEAGLLEEFHTDICATKGWPRSLRATPPSFRPAPLQRLLGRIPEGIPNERIHVFTGFGLRCAWRRWAERTQPTAVQLWAGQSFCEKSLKRGWRGATGVYTFNGAGLELLKCAKKAGLRTVMEQTIAPYRSECELLDRERKRFPAWETAPADEAKEAYCRREAAEWEESSVILCGSEFVRAGIKQCKGPAERCVVVPYGLDLPRWVFRRESHKRPLRVLTVGAIGLRKGSPYVLQAARELTGRMEFRMVGTLNASVTAIQQLKQFVHLTGPIPRTQIRDQYAWADVFLLPSICEGSATAVYEALATGLPAIVTTNAGTIVRDRKEGALVPVSDSEAIVRALVEFDENREFLGHASVQAERTAQSYGLAEYSARLIEALQRPDTKTNRVSNAPAFAAERVAA